MDINTYEAQFLDILNGKITISPYDNEIYLNYVKLNNSRLKRWYKTAKISPQLEAKIASIDKPQEWLFISEPWCGDSAHVQPLIAKLAALNPLITLKVQNRDGEGSEIDRYLTNGGKSIPKLVVRNYGGKDLLVWGPRPKEAQEIHLRFLNDASLSAEEKKIALQAWYNKDKGLSFQTEFLELLKDEIAVEI